MGRGREAGAPSLWPEAIEGDGEGVEGGDAGEGFAAFRAYWLDWSQTFREELPRREAIVLGVTSPRARKPKAPDPV